MARKWDSFFRQVQRILKRGMRVVGLGIAAAIATISLQLLPGKAERIPHPGRVGLQEQTPPTQAETAGDRRQFVAQNLGENPLELYKQGRFTDAIALWQEQLAEGDDSDRALVLNYLSLAYQQLGKWEQAQSAIEQSQSLLNAREDSNLKSQQILARVFSTKARLLLARGDAETALPLWQKAEEIYAELGDEKGAIGSKINQAQAMQNLGLYRRALQTLYRLGEQIEQQIDPKLQATSYLSLGTTLYQIGDLDKSKEYLERSCELAKEDYPSIRVSALLSLGNTKKGLGKRRREELSFTQVEDIFKGRDNTDYLGFYEDLLNSYRQTAIESKSSPRIQVQTRLNEFSFLVETHQWWAEQAQMWEENLPPFVKNGNSRMQELWPKIKQALRELPPTQTAVHARINLAQNAIAFNKTQGAAVYSQSEIAELLETANQQAKSLGDMRSQAYALGYLGKLYSEQPTQNLERGTSFTQKALEIAERIDAPDLIYQWQAQEGRILKAQAERGDSAKRQQAIDKYTQAVDSLQKVRKGLLGIDFQLIDSLSSNQSVNANLQFDFQEQVEPIYRELVDLLLQRSAEETTASQNNLQQALTVIELLQVAELENFLNCQLEGSESLSDAQSLQQAQQVVVDNLAKIHNEDPNAVILYPVVLKNRVEVILSLAGEDLEHDSNPTLRINFTHTINRLEFNLKKREDNVYEIKEDAQSIYDLIIAPIKNKLQTNNTLVFRLDSLLRNIPMSVIFDGKNYLFQNYNIAIIPRLEWRDSQVLETPQVLAGGLSEPPEEFNVDKLPYVDNELNQIKNILPTKTSTLRDGSFTSTNLKNKIDLPPRFPLIHLATHGQFSSKPDRTYILAFDNRITINMLESFLRTRQQDPIELLVLSACETATGDGKAALGLAGVAVQEGVRSTIGSLWLVNDRATADLMGRFYEELIQKGESRAKALREAQRYLLDKKTEISKPYYWAPFVLVGNWLNISLQ